MYAGSGRYAGRPCRMHESPTNLSPADIYRQHASPSSGGKYYSWLPRFNVHLPPSHYANSNPTKPLNNQPPIMADGDSNLVAIIVLVTALLLAIAVLSQILSSYTSAYLSAPSEIMTFVDAADFSIQENESYDRDIQKVQRLEDKMRLGRLLREIQRCGDDLREELNRLLIDESGTRLRSSARLLWAGKRGRLEERVRRLDLLRMRFLVVYMGLVAAKSAAVEQVPRDPEKMLSEKNVPKMALRPSLPHALTESITKKPPPLRRLTTQAMGHNESVGGGQRQGWAGVIQELQRSPLMHKRHQSIEIAMARPP